MKILSSKGHPMAEQCLSISLDEKKQDDILCPHCNNRINRIYVEELLHLGI